MNLTRWFGCVACALFLRGAGPAQGQPFQVVGAPANLARWMYPFNESPANRPNASVFAAFGNIPSFDTRDGQFLLGWNTSNSIPAGRGARNYLILRVRVTLTISGEDMQYAYDNQQRDYRTYFPGNAPGRLATTNTGSPLELYGAGFRGGYSALTFQQGTTFFANPSAGDYTNRTAYAACYDTNGILADVSDNVGDNGTNELAHPFEVTPFALGCNTNFACGELMPTGSQVVFDLNLNNPLVYGYVQQGLNQGRLSFMASSLVNADYLGGGAPNWPDFYTIFDPFIDSSEYPLLDIEGTVVNPALDADGDGLPDDWEQFYFGRLGAGATNSADQDGLSNLSKYLAGTNPTNAADDFRVLGIQTQTNFTELDFTFAPSRQYSVQWSEDLQHWQTVAHPAFLYLSDWLTKTGTNQFPGAPLYVSWRDTNTVNQQHFYQIGAQ